MKEKDAMNKREAQLSGYRPSIYVKLRERPGVTDNPKNYIDDVFEKISDHLEREQDRDKWRQLKFAFQGLTIRRLFRSVPPERIQELSSHAGLMDKQYAESNPPNLLRYHVVDFPQELLAAGTSRLVNSLLQSGLVENAYFNPPSTEPSGVLDHDTEARMQIYLDSARRGIDALAAWNHPGGRGQDQFLIDFERGWNLSHPDLPQNIPAPTPPIPSTEVTTIQHGTGVLGIICSLDTDATRLAALAASPGGADRVGCIGIAHQISRVEVASYWDRERPDVLLEAVDRLPLGSVLLLEAQFMEHPNEPETTGLNELPIEKLPAEFDVIRLATALGVVVVAAAGNGDKDLDRFLTADSGAILVAAGEFNGGGWRKEVQSNFGVVRVHCFAGGNARTINSDPAAVARYFNMTGTSAAAAVIAGTALSIQGMLYARFFSRIDGQGMRSILRSPTLGTAPLTTIDQGRIKNMPDLRRFVQALPTLFPTPSIERPVDLYLRDFEGDSGAPSELSSTQNITLSPDILVSENNGTFQADQPYVIRRGNSYGIRLHVLNRGVLASVAAIGHIYLWTDADPANRLSQLGSVVISPVPPNGAIETIDLVWPLDNADAPAAGTYYIVGLIVDDQELPDPIRAVIEQMLRVNNFNLLRQRVRRINNLAVHRVQILDHA
jgi:serine protease